MRDGGKMNQRCEYYPNCLLLWIIFFYTGEEASNFLSLEIIFILEFQLLEPVECVGPYLAPAAYSF